MIIGQGIEDSTKIYDISQVGRKFPPVNYELDADVQLDNAFNDIRQIIPSLFYSDGNKIILYSQKFAQGVLYQLRKFVRNTNGLALDLPTQIYRSEVTPLDFVQYKDVAIFTSESDLKAWLSTIGSTSALTFNYKLSIADGTKIEPYIYMSSIDSKIYLVQNVLEGDRFRALNVAQSWHNLKVNPGYQSSLLEVEEGGIPYVVYGINASADLYTLENHAAASPDNYLEVLRYGAAEQYAAMLPLR